MGLRAMTIMLCALGLAPVLAGCSGADTAGGFGADGSIHPDGTAGLANYTGQGRDAEGWAGNSGGEGGPSAIPPAPHDPEER